MKTNFWTIVDGSPKERNLKEEEYKVRNDVFGSWRRREIDEAIHTRYNTDYVEALEYASLGQRFY